MKTIYIIEYDNGESFEDHDKEALFATSTKESAEKWMAKLNKWVQKVKSQNWEYPALDELDDIYEAKSNALEKRQKALKPPLGLECLVDMGTSRFNYGYLNVYPLQIRS